MILKIIVTLLLLHVIVGQNLRGDKGNKERSHKKLNKPKLHYSTSIVHMGNKYGIDLPAFAFDYSEYFAGAIIERSKNSKDLFLTMQLVGHKSIMTDFPFHAISTDEEVLHSWSKAVNNWSITPSISNPTNRGGSDSSGMVCLLQNNDNAQQHNTVYQSTAYWVHTNKDNERDSYSVNSAFAILRCKLRHSAHISNLTYSTPKELFVDIMRINKRTSSIHRNHTTKGKVHRVLTEASLHTAKAQNSSTESSVAMDARGTVLASFSIPWATRVVGYPLKHHANASLVDPWIADMALISSRQKPNNSTSISRADASSSTPALQSNSTTNTATAVEVPLYSHTPSQYTTVLCVPGIRPLHPGRAEVGLPALLEFVEHHLLLGFTHIALGLALDWKSVYMTKHVEVLQPYIRAGQVSIYSTTLPGYDDVPGFGGIQLEDAYAAQYFLNQCLYLAKGMSAYVSVLHADQFIVPVSTSPVQEAGSSESFISALLSQLKKGSKLSHSGWSNSTRSRSSSGSRGARFSGTAEDSSVCSFALRSTATSSSTSATTATTTAASSAEYTPVDSLHVFGIEDPVNVFGAWGPGESNWAREFYATSSPRLLHYEASLPYAVPFFPTDQIVRIDVSSTGVVHGYCRHHGRTTTTTTTSSTSTSTSAVRSTATGVSTDGATSTEPAIRAALLVYKASFPSKLLAPVQTNSTQAVEAEATLKALLHQRTMLNSNVAANLKARGMSSIKEVKALVKKSKAKHLQDFPTITDTTASGTGTSLPIKSLPTRIDVKPPFWQLCNTDHLRDVIKRVFHTAV